MAIPLRLPNAAPALSVVRQPIGNLVSVPSGITQMVAPPAKILMRLPPMPPPLNLAPFANFFRIGSLITLPAAIIDLIGQAGAYEWRDNLLKQIVGGNSSQSSEEVVDTNVRIYLLRNDGFKVVVFRNDDPSFPGLGALRVSDIPNVRFYANDQEAINNGWFFVFRGEAVVRPYFIPTVRYEDAEGNQLPNDLKTEQRGEPATNPFVVPQISPQPQTEPFPQPLPQPEPQPQVKPFPQPKVQPKIQPKIFPEIKPPPNLDPYPKPEPQPKPEPKPKPKPEPKPKPQPKPDPFPKINPQPKPQPNPQPKPQPNPQPNIQNIINNQTINNFNNRVELNTVNNLNQLQQQRKNDSCCKPVYVNLSVRKFDKCENGQPRFTQQIIRVESGTEVLNARIFEAIAGIEALQCRENQDCYAAVPEWWQIRPEGKRPQVVLQFCAKEGDGKYGSPKYPITIPHPKITQKMMSSPLQSYKKGNFEGELKLADNSKVIVNCINKAEAERVLSIIKGMIKDKLLEGSTVKFSERGGKPVKQQEMAIRFATYFEKGIEDSANYKWKSIFELPK